MFAINIWQTNRYQILISTFFFFLRGHTHTQTGCGIHTRTHPTTRNTCAFAGSQCITDRAFLRSEVSST